jgi:hypothetical protein
VVGGPRDVSFELSYELTQSDYIKSYAADRRRERTRARAWFRFAVFLALSLVFLATAAAMSLPAADGTRTNATGWLALVFAFGLLFLLLAARAGRVAVRLRPTLMVRRTWQRNPQLHGRYRDEVGPAGVTTIEPNGTEVFQPWSDLVRVTEGEDAFALLGRSGEVRCALPKRGLASPDFVPGLREFLDRSVGRQPTAGPGTAVGD